MSFLFGAPHRYYQGPGQLDRLGEILAPYGTAPLIVIDAFMRASLEARILESCRRAGLAPRLMSFGGEITHPAIDALIDGLDGLAPSVAVGVGGGKALDAAKAVALRLRLLAVTVPTIASNDSPTSAAIAMYDENHTMIAVDRLHRSPEAVVVDTALIAAAPVRFLLAGIGDALSKKFEADGCAAGSGITPFGTRPGRTGGAIADACYQTLRKHGAAAVRAAKAGQPNDDLEAVVEATLLMSGLGFENGGLSLAHSLTRGLVKVRGASGAPHGDHIAWALLVQLAAEGRSDAFIADLLGFYEEIGLPASLGALGMDRPGPEDYAEIARWTMTAPHLKNMSVAVDETVISAAIARIQAMTEPDKAGAGHV